MHALVAPRSILLTLKSRLVNSLQVFDKIIKYQLSYEKPGTLQQYYLSKFFLYWIINLFYFVLFYDFVILIF